MNVIDHMHVEARLSSNLSEEFVVRVIAEAKAAAKAATTGYLNKHFAGKDGGACGFAYVNLYEFAGKKIKGNTKAGRLLKKVGVGQSYDRSFQIWNPSEVGCQSIDALYAGAKVAADVFKSYGFDAVAGSRLD